ncbi:MAG: hypothetical protein Q8T08_24385, partial [Ignavibacteria bacterium]|nr:hypothetical protein [Ignavibacteria bacterium]
MKQQLQLNVIPFTHPIQEAVFAFYTTQKDGFCRIHKDDLNELTDGVLDKSQLHQGEYLYTDFEPPKENAITFSVNLSDCIHFASHYYRHLIRTYFKGVADIIHRNFTNEVEVWFLNPKINNSKFNVYNQFTLKIQHCRLTDGPELVLSFDGTTKVLKQSIAEINNFKTELYNWINCNGELNRWKYLTDNQKLNHENNYPIVSNTLKPHFGISFDVPDFKNRYPRYHTALTEFYNNYLNTEAFN